MGYVSLLLIVVVGLILGFQGIRLIDGDHAFVGLILTLFGASITITTMLFGFLGDEL